MTTTNDLSDADIEARVREALLSAGSAALLARPEWDGDESGPRETQVSVRTRRPQRRRGIVMAAVAVLAVVMAVVGVRIVVVGSPEGHHVVVRPPAPAPAVGLADFAVLPSASGPPSAPWQPGSGARTVLGVLPDVKTDPVTSASFAVQVGSASRWVWVVAGAGSTRLRVALDSWQEGIGQLSPNGQQLAVAFPGLVQVVDLTGHQPTRSLTTGPTEGGNPAAAAWSPDAQAVAVLRGIPTMAPATGEAPSVVEVAAISGGKAQRYSVAGHPRGLAWSPDGKQLVTTGGFHASTAPAGLSALAVVIDVTTGEGRTVSPPSSGVIVGWFGSQLVRSLTGASSSGPPPTGNVTTTTPAATSQTGAVAFEDLDGVISRTFHTPGGFLDEFGPPFDPTGTYGLIRAERINGDQPYAWIADLRTGAIISRLVDSTQVPDVLGLGNGTIVIADATGGGFEVSAVNWTSKTRTVLGVLRFSDEGFQFVNGIQAVVPQ